MDTVQASKLLAVPVSFFLAGYATQASQGSLPSLLDKPAAVSTSSFTDIFYRGAKVIIPGVGVGAAALGYLTYTNPAQRALWATSTALMIAPLPFTQLFMINGINRLIHLKDNGVEREKSEKSGEVRQLLETWTSQNWLRAASYFASGVVATWASVTA